MWLLHSVYWEQGYFSGYNMVWLYAKHVCENLRYNFEPCLLATKISTFFNKRIDIGLHWNLYAKPRNVCHIHKHPGITGVLALSKSLMRWLYTKCLLLQYVMLVFVNWHYCGLNIWFAYNSSHWHACLHVFPTYLYILVILYAW